MLGVVDGTVASGLGTDSGTTPVGALAGENTLEAAGHAAVLAEHEADLSATDTDITSGNIAVGADVAVKLGHERLAETHNLKQIRIEIKVEALKSPQKIDRKKKKKKKGSSK